jgi:uncharacterized membrane protein
MESSLRNESLRRVDKPNSFLAGMLIGMGLIAAVDEIIFHQILSWHHFYDEATEEIGLLTDGLLHSAELIAIVGGFFWILKLRRKHVLARRMARSGFVVGLGAFQLFDGLVDHKLLRLHQIRYVDNVLPYDIAWNSFAIVVLTIGLIMMKKASSALDSK